MPASAEIAAAVSGFVAGDHHRLDAHAAQLAEPLADAALDDVLELHAAEHARAVGNHQRRGAGLGDRIDGGVHLFRDVATEPLHVGLDRIGGALADLAAVQVHAAHARLRRELHERRAQLLDVALANAVLLLRQHDDAAPLRRLVGEGGELRGVGEVALVHAGRGHELRRLAIAEGDGAGLVEQKHVHVAGGLDGAPRHGDDVLLDHPVHAGDADGRQERADGRGDQAHEQRHQHGDGDRRALAGGIDGVDRERQQGGRREQEDDGHRG
jgi:hypothetical protein